MANSYQIIDQRNWKRATHCAIFRDSVEPSYCITWELDVTHFLQQVRAKGCSFTMAMIYAVARCANEIEEFRYRFLDDQVVLFDRIDTSFTYLEPETELFKVVTVEMQDTMEDYVALATKTAREQKAYFIGVPDIDIFHFSALPWIPFTSITHTIPKKREATPVFDWGKYTQRDGRYYLPFSVQVHHSFVDGVHVGKLAAALQSYLDGDL